MPNSVEIMRLLKRYKRKVFVNSKSHCNVLSKKKKDELLFIAR